MIDQQSKQFIPKRNKSVQGIVLLYPARCASQQVISDTRGYLLIIQSCSVIGLTKQL